MAVGGSVGGGTFKAVNIRITGSTEITLGEDYGGGAIYAFQQTQPAYIAGSSFEDNSGSNGGALGGCSRRSPS